jgi:hypothetical protein
VCVLVLNDILSLQAQLTGQTFDTQKLEQSIIQAFKGDLSFETNLITKAYFLQKNYFKSY